jgi:hypothetical protein
MIKIHSLFILLRFLFTFSKSLSFKYVKMIIQQQTKVKMTIIIKINLQEQFSVLYEPTQTLGSVTAVA